MIAAEWSSSDFGYQIRTFQITPRTTFADFVSGIFHHLSNLRYVFCYPTVYVHADIY